MRNRHSDQDRLHPIRASSDLCSVQSRIRARLSKGVLAVLVAVLAIGCQRSGTQNREYVIKAENEDFAVYSGRTAVQGQYFRDHKDDVSGDDVTCFVPDRTKAGSRRPPDSNRYFCFENPEFANQALRLAERTDATICRFEGKANVVISDYTVDKDPNHPRDFAMLERVVVTSAGSAQPCP
jgi:hypothetical protein